VRNLPVVKCRRCTIALSYGHPRLPSSVQVGMPGSCSSCVPYLLTFADCLSTPAASKWFVHIRNHT
jgi:hypothetical protein